MGLIDKLKHSWHQYDGEYDEEMENGGSYEDGDDAGYEDDRYSDFSSGTTEQESSVRNGRVVSIQTSARLQVMLVKPERFEEVKEIAEQLNKKITVVLNLETCQDPIARRILDFLSGATFANGGSVKPVASKTFLLTPSNVNLMGDLLDDLESNGFTIGH